ncbi:MAG: hypothetical protein HC866_20200 [Leptolyngbyaceae cyanobacterium RU_5_1]|nr:hypothetical protein [Leptolyngbyaceae cyanobacterium RU_5_1]
MQKSCGMRSRRLILLIDTLFVLIDGFIEQIGSRAVASVTAAFVAVVPVG